MLDTARKYPYYLFLLPIFFVLHGCAEHFNFIPAKDAAVLIFLYLIPSLLISLLLRFVLKDFSKAALVTFFLVAFFFFFGSLHDFLKNITPDSILSRYSFLLPFFFLLLLAIIIYLKRKEKKHLRITMYINLLLIILILIDVGTIGVKALGRSSQNSNLPDGFINCDNCNKPDIYFILADEYAGNTELKDLFGFDNKEFINQLSAKGFKTIADSYCNYNYTPFAIASILDMNYLNLDNKNRGKRDLTYSYQIIRNNNLLNFLEYYGYKFYNYSVFDFKGQPSRINEGFLAAKTRLITAQTLSSRMQRDLGFNLITRLKSKKTLKKWTYSIQKDNERLYKLTLEIASKKSSQPKFIYTHLEMPHYPYYFDKFGNEQPFDKLVEGNQSNKKAYIEYLQYTNKKLTELIDHILISSEKPPIIVLMGDHGFRHFTEPVADKYHFLNLTSIYLPTNNYNQIKDSLGGVNIFRAILNSSFGQKLPLLKDSTSYLKD